jgi:hypothetical protein
MSKLTRTLLIGFICALVVLVIIHLHLSTILSVTITFFTVLIASVAIDYWFKK